MSPPCGRKWALFNDQSTQQVRSFYRSSSYNFPLFIFSYSLLNKVCSSQAKIIPFVVHAPRHMILTSVFPFSLSP